MFYIALQFLPISREEGGGGRGKFESRIEDIVHLKKGVEGFEPMTSSLNTFRDVLLTRFYSKIF